MLFTSVVAVVTVVAVVAVVVVVAVVAVVAVVMSPNIVITNSSTVKISNPSVSFFHLFG